MAMIIKDTDFKKIANSVKPDTKKRIVLHAVKLREGISYHMYANSIGQIILDPQVTIPASGIGLFTNPDALASIRRGLSDTAQAKVSKLDLGAL